MNLEAVGPGGGGYYWKWCTDDGRTYRGREHTVSLLGQRWVILMRARENAQTGSGFDG